MREFDYNMAYIAIYSPRPGAASARWDDDVSHDEKKRRLHVLSEELHATSLRHNETLIGRTVPVLITGRDRKPDYLSGKTEGLLVVRVESENDALVGSFVDVTITSCVPLSLEGRVVGPCDDPWRTRAAAEAPEAVRAGA